jgi:tetratricopeptide (TPR) repeat protein
MAEEQLRKAVALMKQGEKKQASQIIQAVIKQDPDNINAWWLTANILSDQPERQKKALERVLSINPLHKGALKMMEGQETGKTVGYEPKAEREKAKPSQQAMTTQEIEFDWSKLEARDAMQKKKEKPAIEEDRAARIAGYAMIGFVAVILLVVIIFTAVPAIQDALRTQPDTVVVNFYQSFFTGNFDEARGYMCSEQLEAYDTMAELFAGALQEAHWEFSGLNAEIVEKTSDTATVNVSGSVSIIINGQTQTITIEELAQNSNSDTSESLRLENGKWCMASID